MSCRVRAALISVLAVAAIAPALAEQAAREARRLYAAEDFAGAAQLFELARRKGEATSEDVVLLVISHARLGDLVSAAGVAGELLRSRPVDPLAHYAAGLAAFEKKEYERAAHFFETANRLEPGNPAFRAAHAAALVNLGVEAYRAGKKEEARAAFERALAFDRTASEAARNLALLEIEEDRYDGAIAILESAVGASPKDAAAVALLADCYEKIGAFGKLEEALLHLSELLPANPEVWARLGRFWEKAGEVERAAEAFGKAERWGSEEPQPYLWLARREADASLAQIAVGKAVYKTGLLTLQAKQEMDRRGNTLDEAGLERLREISKAMEEPEAVLAESLSLLRSLRKDDAAYEEDLRLLVEWYPHSLDVRSALAALLTERRSYFAARREWEILVRDAPTRPEAHLGLAACAEAEGRREEAVVWLRKALALDPEDPRIHAELLRLHAARGEERALLAHYQERLHVDTRSLALLEAAIALEMDLGMDEAAAAHRERLEKVRATASP